MTSSLPPRLRLGAVPYLAGRPCVEGLDRSPHFEVVRATPAELIARLRDGAIDVALCSSIEGFRRPGYRYVPGICIGAEREVRSVLMFSRVPLEECTTLALDPASRSGAALAQIVLRGMGAPAVRAVETSPGGDPSRTGAHAYIRIGDAALRHAAQLRSTPEVEVEVYDLAALWRRLTGLPTVFALWLVRPGVAVTRDQIAALRAARDLGIHNIPQIALEGERTIGLPAAFLEGYLRDACRYDLDAPGYVESLAEFGRRAAELGLAEDGVAPSPVILEYS
ncbi:MAG: menaquinone biosynthesis protein [Planctomycetes bacterium]|nr:menaquinone biosynthesis protein [Planctomycetota bacterium]